MAHIGNQSGVQAHSAGANFPYVTFRRDYHSAAGIYSHSAYVVTLAGAELDYQPSWAEAEARAAEFKAHGVKDRFDSQWLDALKLEVAADAEKFAVSRSEGLKRQRNDYREMYGNPDYVPPSLADVLVEASREAAGFRAAEAERVAAREALQDAAEQSPEAEAYEQWNDRQLARRALGIIE